MKYILFFLFEAVFTITVKSQAFTLDTTFNVDYNFYYPSSSGRVAGINIEPEGNLLIYGSFYCGYGDYSDAIRVYENGARDYSWKFRDGNTFMEFFKRVGNDYIEMASTLRFLDKIDYNGTKSDTTWFQNTQKANICLEFFNPYIFPDGSIIVGGSKQCNEISDKKRYFMKLLPDGNLDTNFKHETNGIVNNVVKYSDNKFLLCGGTVNAYTLYDTVYCNRMCRIDSLGTLDTTFKSIFTWGSPNASYIQDDGKIIIIGLFTIQDNPDYLSLIRLNPDGSLDSTFNNFNSVNYTAVQPFCLNTICPTSDGGYLVGGEFNYYQGYARQRIAKIDGNGFLDTNYFNGPAIDSVFHAGNSIYPSVYSIQRDSNDRYYIMGYFTYYNGQPVNPIIRLKGLSPGIEEGKEVRNEIQLYPNPVKDEVNFSFSKAIANGVAEIYDVSGIKVKEITLKGRQSHYVISTESLAAGFYIVSIKYEKGVVGVVKMMKCN